MSHSQYSAPSFKMPYGSSSIPQTLTPNGLSPVHEHISTHASLESHLNTPVSQPFFPLAPLTTTQEVTVRRQHVHSWPLDTRSSLHPQQRHHHYHHQESISSTGTLSPYPDRHTPPHHHQHSHTHSHSQPSTQASTARGNPLPWALAGSLDPATGIFYRTPENPRLRTAQACDKCRTRKAKCSGEHPTCNRCLTRGLICEYAKEGRMRGPNRPKIKDEDSTSQKGQSPVTATSTSSPMETMHLGRKRALSNSPHKIRPRNLGGDDKDKERERETRHPLPLFVTAPRPVAGGLPPSRSQDQIGQSRTRPMPLALDTTPTVSQDITRASVLSHPIGIGRGDSNPNSYAPPLLPPMPGLTTSIKFTHEEGVERDGHGYNAYSGSMGFRNNPADSARYGVAQDQKATSEGLEGSGGQAFGHGFNQHPHLHSHHAETDLARLSAMNGELSAVSQLSYSSLSTAFGTGFGGHSSPTNTVPAPLGPVSAFHLQDRQQQNTAAIFHGKSAYMPQDEGRDYHQNQKEGRIAFDMRERENGHLEPGSWPAQGSVQPGIGLRIGFGMGIGEQDASASSTEVGDQLLAGWGETSVGVSGETFEQGRQHEHEHRQQQQQANGGTVYPI